MALVAWLLNDAPNAVKRHQWGALVGVVKRHPLKALVAAALPVLAMVVWYAADLVRNHADTAEQPGTSPDPPDRGARRLAAGTAADDAEVVARAVLRFDPMAPNETADGAATEAAAAAHARAGELADAKTFLDDRADAAFAGPRRDRWGEWQAHRTKARQAAAELDQAVAAVPPALTPAKAAETVRNLAALADACRNNPLADPARAADQELVGRAGVAVGFHAWADDEYRKALATPTAGSWAGLKDEVAALCGQYDDLVRRVAARGEGVPEEAARTARRADLVRADWADREQLIGLFVNSPDDPTGADAVFRLAHDVFARLPAKSPLRRVVRDGVQQFCQKYVPKKLRLADEVEWGMAGQVLRASVKLKAAKDSLALDADPDGLNEFTFRDRRPDAEEWRWMLDGLGLEKLKATPASRAAFEFTTARRAVQRWDAAAAAGLIEKMKDHAKVVNNRPEFLPADDPAAPRDRAAERVARVAAAAAAYPELFARDDR